MEEIDEGHSYVGHFRRFVGRLQWEKAPPDLT